MARAPRMLPRSMLLFAALAGAALSCSDPSGSSAPSGSSGDSGVTTLRTTTSSSTTDVGGTQTTTSTSTTTSTGTTTSTSTAEVRSNDVPGQTACPWDKSQTCKVLGPTLLDAPKKLARLQVPTSGELRRVEGIQRRYPGSVKTLVPPEIPTVNHPQAPGAPLPEPGRAALPDAVPGRTAAIPTSTVRPPVTSRPITTAIPTVSVTGVNPHVAPGFQKCEPKQMFMCKPDLLKSVYMTSFTVSTLDIEVLTFMSEYDKCAIPKGLKSFLDQLLSATIDLLVKKSYGTEGRSISKAQNKAEVQAWKGPSNKRELEMMISQTAQEDGIVHLVYFPTSKDAHAPEMQELIDAIRGAADHLLVHLLIQGDCPPAD